MKKFTIVLFIFLSIFVLSSCTKKNDQFADIDYQCSQNYNGQKLYFLNWGEYMDRDLVSVFEKKCNAVVVYEEVTSNEEFRNKLTTGITNYDLMTPSDWMVDYLRTNEYLNQINFENIPNFVNIDTRFLNSTDENSLISYDPNNLHSVPYFFGTVGIIYNKEVLSELNVNESELNSWDILWDARLNRQIALYDSQREVFTIALKKLGHSVNTTDLAQIDEAKVLLTQLKATVDPVFGADNIKKEVRDGDFAIGVTFSGDYFDQLFDLQDSGVDVIENNPIGYIIPEEGSNIWFDNFIIPKTSQNQRLAEEFINFFLDPKVAYYNAKYVGYSTPNKEAYALLKNDEEFGAIVSQEAYFPSETNQSQGFINSEVYKNLPQNVQDYYTTSFEDVKK